MEELSRSWLRRVSWALESKSLMIELSSDDMPLANASRELLLSPTAPSPSSIEGSGGSLPWPLEANTTLGASSRESRWPSEISIGSGCGRKGTRRGKNLSFESDATGPFFIPSGWAERTGRWTWTRSPNLKVRLDTCHGFNTSKTPSTSHKMGRLFGDASLVPLIKLLQRPIRSTVTARQRKRRLFQHEG